MTIFQQCLIADKKKYQFYKMAVLAFIALLVLVMFYFWVYQPKVSEIQATEFKIQLLSRRLKDVQEKKLKQVSRQYSKTGSMPQYLRWLSDLSVKAGIRLNEVRQLKLSDASLPVMKFRVTFNANVIQWFAYINLLFQSDAILITDFKYQNNQAASMDLIIFTDEPLKQVDYPVIKNNLNDVLCSSEWYVEQEKEYDISIK